MRIMFLLLGMVVTSAGFLALFPRFLDRCFGQSKYCRRCQETMDQEEARREAEDGGRFEARPS